MADSAAHRSLGGDARRILDLDRRLKARGALLGAACGDAIGAPFEGMPALVRRSEDVLAETSSGLHYTDDTAMTIALAESLVEVGDLDQDHLAGTFATHWRREPWRGYGRAAFELLQSIAAGGAWRSLAARQFGGQGSWGNGGAMRVAPVAVMAGGDVPRAVALARRSAQVTHAHPLGIDGAAVQAGAISLALATPRNEPLAVQPYLARLRLIAREQAMVEQLEQVGAFESDPDPGEVGGILGTGVDALSAVPAGIGAAVFAGGRGTADAMADTIRFALAMGGDTDTIASMAGAIVGAHLGAEAIPQSWVRRLEGAALLIDLADRLAAMHDE